MSHFIELHQTDDEQTAICLNVDNIAYVEPYGDDKGTYIKLAVEQSQEKSSATLYGIHVSESYTTVKQLLGC